MCALASALGVALAGENASAVEPGPLLSIAPNHSISLGQFSGPYDQGSVQQTQLLFLGGGFVTPRLALELYLGGGWKGERSGAPPSTCRGVESVCGSTALRVGLGAEYHIAPGSSVSPWVFLGAGFFQRAFEHSSPSSRIQYLGTEARLLAGADFETSPTASIAPFIGVVPTRYELISSSEGKHKIQDIRTHFVAELGLRITLTLPRNPDEK